MIKEGDRVVVKTTTNKREIIVKRMVTTQYGLCARCVDKDNVYVGQFHVATLDKVVDRQ